MKKLWAILALLLLLVAQSVHSATCTSKINVPPNWSSAGSWDCNHVPTNADSVVINTTLALDVNSATVVSVTVNGSGTLQHTVATNNSLATSGVLTVSGAISNTGTGTFTINAASVTNNGSGVLAADVMNVSGALTSSGTLNVGSLNASGDVTNQGSGNFTVTNLVFQKAGSTQAALFNGVANITNFTVNSGATVSSANTASINLKGTLTNNGTLSLGNTSWVFNGTTAQSIAGSSASTLANLTINNASGLTLSNNVTVPGTLTLTNGVINTGAFSLGVTARCDVAVSGGGAASYVNGSLRLTYPASAVTCVYPVGDSKAYAPISVTIPLFTGITGGTLTGSTVGTEHPQIVSSGIDTYQDVNRYWTLGSTGDTMASLPSAGRYSVDLGFVLADEDAGVTVANFKVGKFSASSWSALAGSVSGMTATLAGQTSFGSYAVGTPLLPVVLGKTASSAAAALNDYVTFTLSVTNSNTTDINDVVLTDIIPPSMAYYSNAATAGTVTEKSGTLTWIVPYLAVGDSEQLTLVVQPTVQGSITNTVTSGLNSASATILVLPNSYVQYKMDDALWTAAVPPAPGTVIDSGINHINGHLLPSGSTTNEIDPPTTIAADAAKQVPPVTIAGGFCRAGNFDGTGVVEVPNTNGFFNFNSQLSASAWVYPTAFPATDYYAIMSNDVNYEFHVDSGGHLYWWWKDSGGTEHTLTSAATIPTGKWSHVAITMDATSINKGEHIYINGVLDTAKAAWTGALAQNNCPFYIGGDINTGSACSLIADRNFHGMIDEAKVYSYELSADQVKADMTLGRQCGGTFDHIRIEHDGTASTCTPKTVTLKACLNASCTALYPGQVQVMLTPAGWTPSLPGDVVTITNGVTTATLATSGITTSTVTLGGTAYGSPSPVNSTVRCFKGSTETCLLSVATANNCKFDAVEEGANPPTDLYTKLAGVLFKVDVVAVGTPTNPVDTSKTTQVTVDLVDASSVACSSSSTSLNPPPQTSRLVKGRKTFSMTITDAVPNAQVRIKTGTSTYSCSTDKFAIRPQQFTVPPPVSNGLTLNNSALTGTPKAVAGSAFTLTASAGVTDGYKGTPVLDPTQVNDHNNAAIAAGTLSGTFSVGTGTAASGTAFKYLDVGNIQLQQDAVVDNTFTFVDQATDDCVKNSSSNDPLSSSSGKLFGCNIGSAQSAKFGRWYPSHYSFSGTLKPACVAGGFTYMDQDALGASLIVRAHALNLNGDPASASDPVVSRYSYAASNGYPTLAAVTFAGDNGGVAVAASRLGSPTFPALPAANSSIWSSGQLQINGTYAFSRLAAPDGSYELFKLMTSLNDPDGSSWFDTTAPHETNTTHIRFGRLRLSNAFGSEKADLSIPVQALYWSGKSWVLNSDDSCTPSLPANAFALSGPDSTFVAKTSVSGPVILLNGVGSLTLKKPSPVATGSVDVAANLGLSGSDMSCLSTHGGTASSLPWLRSQNGSGSCPSTYDRDPSARATFGIYSPETKKTVHVRELY